MYLLLHLQIGLIGLIEYEWLNTLLHVSPEDVVYTDFVTKAQELVPQLIQEVGSYTNVAT